MLPGIEWEPVASVESTDCVSAIGAYCTHMEWVNVSLDHNVANVPGVGTFRAGVVAESPVARTFVIQRQDPIGLDDRHVTWSDVATLAAADAPSAIRAYLDWMGWGHQQAFGDVANVVGLGTFRAVAAEAADQLRVTPPPA